MKLKLVQICTYICKSSKHWPHNQNQVVVLENDELILGE